MSSSVPLPFVRLCNLKPAEGTLNTNSNGVQLTLTTVHLAEFDFIGMWRMCMLHDLANDYATKSTKQIPLA
jgi:hypothetical protein